MQKSNLNILAVKSQEEGVTEVVYETLLAVNVNIYYSSSFPRNVLSCNSISLLYFRST